MESLTRWVLPLGSRHQNKDLADMGTKATTGVFIRRGTPRVHVGSSVPNHPCAYNDGVCNHLPSIVHNKWNILGSHKRENRAFPFVRHTMKLKGTHPPHSNSGCIFFNGEDGTASYFYSCLDQILTDSCFDWKFSIAFQPSHRR